MTKKGFSEKLVPGEPTTRAAAWKDFIEDRLPPGDQPEEQRVRVAELGVLLASKGLGTISIVANDGVTIENLFAPYKALPLIDAGKELIEKLRQVSNEYHSQMDEAWPAEDHKALMDHLEKLERAFAILQDSKGRIERMGWKIDQGTGELKRIARHKGKNLLAECVWKLYQAKYAGKGNTPSVRRKIKADLSSYFTDEELDPGSGAPIYAAIRHGIGGR